jgi:hypothetical protein
MGELRGRSRERQVGVFEARRSDLEAGQADVVGARPAQHLGEHAVPPPRCGPAARRPHGRGGTRARAGELPPARRPLLRSLRRRIELRRGLQASARLPLLCALAAAACVGLAFVTGADPFISAIAAATALAAYVAGLPTVAAAAVVVGLVGDVAIEHGLAPATGQVIVGAGLLAAGLVSLAREREDA